MRLERLSKLLTKTLLMAGMVLFSLGLLNGLVVPYFENPRMGLSAHLAGVQNALVLIVFGLVWKYVNLPARHLKLCFALSLYSMYTIWLALVLASLWGTSSATPIAGAGFSAPAMKEHVVTVFLYSGSLAILIASTQLAVGLGRGSPSEL